MIELLNGWCTSRGIFLVEGKLSASSKPLISQGSLFSHFKLRKLSLGRLDSTSTLLLLIICGGGVRCFAARQPGYDFVQVRFVCPCCTQLDSRLLFSMQSSTGGIVRQVFISLLVGLNIYLGSVVVVSWLAGWWLSCW